MSLLLGSRLAGPLGLAGVFAVVSVLKVVPEVRHVAVAARGVD